jgi:hypothetical protein
MSNLLDNKIKKESFIIQCSKDDLHELLATLLKDDRYNTSQFWYEVKETLKKYEGKLNVHSESISDIKTSIALIKQSQGRQEENQKEILQKLESKNIEISGLEKWQNKTVGALGVLSVMVLPAIAYLFYEFFELSKKVSAYMGIAMNK